MVFDSQLASIFFYSLILSSHCSKLILNIYSLKPPRLKIPTPCCKLKFKYSIRMIKKHLRVKEYTILNNLLPLGLKPLVRDYWFNIRPSHSCSIPSAVLIILFATLPSLRSKYRSNSKKGISWFFSPKFLI